MSKRRSVALLIEMSNAYGRGLLAGVQGFLKEHRPWSIYLAEQGRGDTPPAWLKGWKGDGIIARVENQKIATSVSQCEVPVVDVSAGRFIPDTPMVETDDKAVGKIAAKHFLERGYQNLAFCGDPRFQWAQWRCDAFVEALREEGISCHIYKAMNKKQASTGWIEERDHMAKWIKSLPKPVGIMACYDIKARPLLDVCRSANIAVPEEVAVLGVDDDELLCNLSDPPLSSIILDTYKIGFEAASTLEKLMDGEKIEQQTQLIEPLGITTRQSTDSLALEDRDVASALQYIRMNACDGINVHDVLKTTSVSRRILESRFRKHVGRTPHEEILRVKLEHVKNLLTETDLDMSTIAKRAGFRHVEYLSVAFKRVLGMPPSNYRNQHKKDESAES